VKAQIKAAEAHCAELAKLGAKIGSRCEAVARKLAEAEADQRKHADDLAGAEAAYSDEPSDKGAAAVGQAREALRLAELRTNRPRAEHQAAQAEFAAWQSERDAADHELKTARLRHRASVELFRERTAKAFSELLSALTLIPKAAAAIDGAFDDANAAARELGEPELSVFHRVAPLLLSAATVYGASGLVNQGGFYKAASACAHGLAPALVSSLLDTIKARARDGGALPNDVAAPLLEQVLACRTAGEGDELIKAAEKRHATAAQETQPDRSAWLAQQARLRKERAGSEDETDARPKGAVDGPLGDVEEFERDAAAGLALVG
jgi:hypothetical protein